MFKTNISIGCRHSPTSNPQSCVMRVELQSTREYLYAAIFCVFVSVCKKRLSHQKKHINRQRFNCRPNCKTFLLHRVELYEVNNDLITNFRTKIPMFQSKLKTYKTSVNCEEIVIALRRIIRGANNFGDKEKTSNL